ncbi:hypothetical protein [Hymenobacter sp. YC55]|uniref:hypothetical protein n=1 Tax=Hymenobacter sp. YC55 TaxID=3034019 RepID=UPI0023F7932E|nr:hypothetical protein [Hymenobacter sp. YC55]MDF7811206.1 hypothetical protein [Hymenobacter sp. YC55]
MEELYLSRVLSATQIQHFLQTVMLGLTAFAWDMLVGDEQPMEFDSSCPTHIFFEATESEVPHFPQHVAIYRTPRANEEARALWLGQQLSSQFDIAVLVPFTHPEQPDDLYYDIVFMKGESYLADDSETEFGEPDAKPVRIVGSYYLPKAHFDSFGNLTSP